MRKRGLLVALCLLACLGLSACLRPQERTLPVKKHKLVFFYSPTCRECSEMKSQFLPVIEKEFGDLIRVEYRDTSEVENYRLLVSLKDKYNSDMELVLPVFYFEGNLLNAKMNPKQNLRRLITQCVGKYYKDTATGEVNLAEILKDFRVLGIVMAGLGDGINPCAFTVIIFFISYLALQGYRKRELVTIGSCFILAVFLAYLLIGLGFFNIIYSLDKFSLARKAFNITIGLLSVALGALSIYDLVKLKKTRRTDELVLQLPPAIKNRIHSIIGLYYRKPRDKAAYQAHLLRLGASAFVTGFIISFLESVCTGQLYLPTIRFAMRVSSAKLQAVAYLVLYNLMFIVPLAAIFVLTLAGVNSAEFSRAFRKHLFSVKVLLAILFFALGAVLLWKP